MSKDIEQLKYVLSMIANCSTNQTVTKDWLSRFCPEKLDEVLGLAECDCKIRKKL